MPGWVRPYLMGVLSTALVTGSVIFLSRPSGPAIEVVIATPSAGTITVAISGEVARPGLYSLPPGRRVADLIERAGGETERADPASPSRALLLRDEMHIHVPPVATPGRPPGQSGASGIAPTPVPTTISALTPDAAGVSGRLGTTPVSVSPAAAAATPPTPPLGGETVAPSTPAAGLGTPAPGGPVNLNTASAADLERLPGIGTVLAARIVADRERNGPFRRVDDLERVAGIGPTLMARLRPLVTV